MAAVPHPVAGGVGGAARHSPHPAWGSRTPLPGQGPPCRQVPGPRRPQERVPEAAAATRCVTLPAPRFLSPAAPPGGTPSPDPRPDERGPPRGRRPRRLLTRTPALAFLSRSPGRAVAAVAAVAAGQALAAVVARRAGKARVPRAQAGDLVVVQRGRAGRQAQEQQGDERPHGAGTGTPAAGVLKVCGPGGTGVGTQNPGTGLSPRPRGGRVGPHPTAMGLRLSGPRGDEGGASPRAEDLEGAGGRGTGEAGRSPHPTPPCGPPVPTPLPPSTTLTPSRLPGPPWGAGYFGPSS